MIAYIYLVKVKIKGVIMFKIGMTKQLPYNGIIRLKAYPRDSKICFVATVPSCQVEAIETDIIACLSQQFTLTYGKEYFTGNELEILKCVSNKINSLYNDNNTQLDDCEVKENARAKKCREVSELSDDAKEYILENLSKSGFVFDLEKVSSILQSTKGDLHVTLRGKESMNESYIESVDYQVTPLPTNGRGRRRMQIMLTSDCFKLLCMQSKTKIALSVKRFLINIDKQKPQAL